MKNKTVEELAKEYGNIKKEEGFTSFIMVEEHFIAGYKACGQQYEWISVEDELPEIGSYYIAKNKYGIIEYCSAEMAGNILFHSKNNGDYLTYVTHWKYID